MKNRFFLCFFALSVALANAQSSMEKWKPLLTQPGLASYFKGLFDLLGVKVLETNEQFTVHHLGNSFELIPGIDPNKVDFTIEIKKENVDNMLKHAQDSVIDERESFRIVRAIFTPITEASLNNPYLTKKKYLKIAHTDELIHVTLLDPEKKEDYSQTLLYSKKQWVVVQGIHGKTATEYKLTPAQAMEFQRHLFEAKKTGTKKGWIKFMKWYNAWKTGVNK
jgi:hypothetical protein